MLAKAVRSYLSAADGDDLVEAKRLQELCSLLSVLLSRRLHGHEKWSPRYSVDGVILSYPSPVSATELDGRGYMIGLRDKERGFWVEPFFVTLRVSDDHPEALTYNLLCGDATHSLGTTPYGKHRPSLGLQPPREWLFVFSNEKPK